MKAVVLHAGLGNQLFHYSFFKYLKNNIDSHTFAFFLDFGEHNGYELSDFFQTDIRLSKIAYCLYRIINSLRYRLNSQTLSDLFVYEGKFIGKNPLFYYGDWQDKKYLNNAICFKDLPLSDRNANIKRMLLKGNSVAIHIRRGDYLSMNNKGLYWNLSETNYYQQAIAYVKARFDNCSFFVFSDDMPWVKSHLKMEYACYVDWNKGKDSAYDMYLMSQANAIVIANSTFSFWAGYLNRRAALCIYPLKWYHEESGLTNPDIFPEGWIGL